MVSPSARAARQSAAPSLGYPLARMTSGHDPDCLEGLQPPGMSDHRPCVLALDQGTTSSRALVFGPDGSVLGVGQREFSQHFPEPGWVEHDPMEILSSQREAAVEAWERAGQVPIAAVGITNQRETAVVFERETGVPVHRAIVWQDRRTAEHLQGLAAGRAGVQDMVAERAGLPMDPYFSAAKFAWILDRVPRGHERARAGELVCGTVDTWLVHHLTSGRVVATEPSNASRTSLFDRWAGSWSEDLCGLFGVPIAALAEVLPSNGDFGEISEPSWPCRGAPIRGVLGDQQAALFGHDCREVGTSKCTFGTGAFLLVQCGTEPPRPRHGLLGTVAWRMGGRTWHALEGAMMVSGALIQWLRDGLGIIEHAAETEVLARQVADPGGVVVVPAFAGLGTPHWDADARGVIAGLTRGTDRRHLCRAALEAMALQVVDVLGAAGECLGAPLAALRVDGGAAANGLLLELLASFAEVPVERPGNLETTAFGAARMAMLGSGITARVEELPRLGGDPTRVMPDGGSHRATMARWAAAVDRSRGWAGLDGAR